MDEIEGKMREAELAPHEGKRKVETLWPIFKIHHQKSRYIYDLYYKRKTISKELYEYCIKQSVADKNLIGKWEISVNRKLIMIYFIFSTMEKTRLWKSLLSSMYSTTWYKF